MNDLIKEALQRQLAEIERTQQIHSPWGSLGLSSAHYGNALALAQSNIDQSYSRKKYGNDYLEPDRPLTGKPEHYLTGYEGSRCDRLEAPLTGAYNEGYLDGFEAGAEEESRTGINPNKINRVSDDYRRISDEVENEVKETETWKNYPDEKKPF